MNRILSLAMALAATVFMAGSLLAHDSRLRGANGFIGEVTAMTGNGFELKTRNGVVKVNYSSKTRFEADKKPSDKSSIKVGTKLGVAGSKLPSGEVMANEVLIGYTHDDGPAEAKKKQDSGHHH